MKINLTTLTDNAWAYAAGVHRLAGFSVPPGEVAISINNVAGDSGDKTTLSTWYEAVPAPGTVTLGADNDLSSVRDWAVIALSIKPAAGAGNVPPTVNLTSPADGATFTAPATIVLTADAQDSDGTVAQVEFFEGVTLLATDTTAPYTFTVNNVQAGSYSFTAKATDDLGASTTSAAANVTVSAAAQLFFIHPDHLNTPRLITNQTGQTVWRWDNTDPFGGNPPDENPSGLGNFTCNLRLPGQYFDQETNTHYNYFRDYDPGIGRYIQSDPIGLHGGLNTYAYAYDNPLSVFDREGLDAVVTYFPGFPGHIGVGVNTTDTVGLYPKSQSERLQIVWLNACKTVLGIVARDRDRQPPGSVAQSKTVRIKTLPYQDRLMLERIQASQKTSQQYNLCVDQCTSYVVEVLTAGGVGTPPDVTVRPDVLFDWLKDAYGRGQ